MFWAAFVGAVWWVRTHGAQCACYVFRNKAALKLRDALRATAAISTLES